jgi:hypothetical protein
MVMVMGRVRVTGIVKVTVRVGAMGRVSVRVRDS